MRIIFQGLLPDWDSEQYAETHHLPTRAACELHRYQLWPQVRRSLSPCLSHDPVLAHVPTGGLELHQSQCREQMGLQSVT